MEKTWVLYIVQCSDGTYYTGITDDLQRRLSEHNAGKGAKYTRGRGPVFLACCKPMGSKSAALKEEYQTKQLTRAQKAALCSGFCQEDVSQCDIF